MKYTYIYIYVCVTGLKTDRILPKKLVKLKKLFKILFKVEDRGKKEFENENVISECGATSGNPIFI